MARLVLARKHQEAVVLHLPDGQAVTVTVESIDGSKVRLGFDAPRSIPIMRSELGAPRARAAAAQRRKEGTDA